MNIEKVKERIQKLLAMASDSSSPQEAAIAARRVQKLMSAYNLEMVDVVADDIRDEDNVIKAHTDSWYKRRPGYLDWIEIAVAKAFNCETRTEWRTRRGVDYSVCVIYGYKTDVEVATWLCNYIYVQLDNLAKKVVVPPDYRDRGLGRRYMADWRKGAAAEISDRIDEFYRGEQREHEPLTSSGQSLVALKTAAIERKFGRFSYGSSRTIRYTEDGMSAGRKAARDINISRNLRDEVLLLS